ncbi:UNVERIFIED_CONTAM: hypothetical protein Sradi_3825000 [Sesamum radiatum]|uniref:Uncharacterized protein n=1 Tax=Sesamum radiatum TaxID=300843 RepID=A0AAW2Q116_SESRA
MTSPSSSPHSTQLLSTVTPRHCKLEIEGTTICSISTQRAASLAPLEFSRQSSSPNHRKKRPNLREMSRTPTARSKPHHRHSSPRNILEDQSASLRSRVPPL